MKDRFPLLAVRSLLGVLVAALVFGPVRASAQQTEVTILYSFPSSGAAYPGTVVQGGDGNFYGVASDVQHQTDGIIYRLTPGGVQTVLYTFPKTSGGTDPGSTLVRTSNGYLYGTTLAGGTYGLGTVFQLTPAGVLKTIHSFSSTEANNSSTGLTLGSDGYLYGTTNAGGSYGSGSVFKMTTAGVLTTLHSFNAGVDGSEPGAPLVEVDSGVFYGTTGNGGDGLIYSAGTVFQITSNGGFRTVHDFRTMVPEDPLYPSAAPLALGGDGNLYGTTLQGPGGSADGAVYQVTPDTGAVTVLHTFTDLGDGRDPATGVAAGSDGNFYGTTTYAGDTGGAKLYRVSASGDFTTLYSFMQGSTGSYITGGLIPTSDGAFYGTTQGGVGNYGTLFKVTFHPSFFGGEVELADQVYYLSLAASGNPFGYYSYLADPHYIYHFDLGYEYVFDAGDGQGGVYFYDFKSNGFFYTSPSFPFPYLYDFSLNTVLYYYPDAKNAGRYNTNGVRYFYDFETGAVISK